MNMNRFTRLVPIAIWMICVLASRRPAGAYRTPKAAMQAPDAASPASRAKPDRLPSDDFAGLDYTDDQKAEIAKIHQNAESRKALIAKDEKLSSEQRAAMLEGYARFEYASVYKVLTPEQRRQVNQRVRARRAAAQKEQKKTAPRN